MSRSRRKTPIIGIAGDSEKQDKRFNNRKLRRKTRQVIHYNLDEDSKLLPIMKDVSDPWSMDKDGKTWIGNIDEEDDYKKFMRK